MYKIKDIFDLANKIYNLKLNKYDNSKEITAIEKAIRRALKDKKIKAPYEITEQQAYYLVNVTMKNYFLKKAQKANPNIFFDESAYYEATKEKLSPAMTYQQALINLKLDYLIQLLGTNKDQMTFFNEVDFKKAYLNYRGRLDAQGYPLPGFFEAKSELNTTQNFFTVMPKFKPAKSTKSEKVSGKKLDF